MKKKIERDIEEHYRRFFRESSQTRYHIEELKKKKKKKRGTLRPSISINQPLNVRILVQFR